jgi:predicted membrane protein
LIFAADILLIAAISHYAAVHRRYAAAAIIVTLSPLFFIFMPRCWHFHATLRRHAADSQL